ncbi:MAG: SRPBCC domain-containing protein [Planctomycetales bacterium]|nr:SRPBCC domain-containing protein [Planctomycetales bacterium]
MILVAIPALLAVARGEPVPDDRPLRHEVVLGATLDEAWAIVATAEGWKALGVAQAEVDLRPGGTIRTHYSPAGKIGDPDTITHHVLAYEPKSMLALRFTAPANAAKLKVAEATWTVYRLEPLDARRTRLICTMLGWGEGPEWEAARQFFERGNAWTLERLRKRFPPRVPAPADPRAALAALDPYLGDWIGERDLGGARQVSTRSFRRILGGTFVEAATDSRIGGDLVFEARMTYGLDPGTGRLACWFFENSGETPGLHQRFELRETGKDGSQVWEEVGSERPMRVEMGPVKDGTFAVRAFTRDAAGALEPFSDTTYRRKAR